MEMKWININEHEPSRDDNCLVKGLKSAYYAGKYAGKGIDGKALFWIPCANRFVKAEYYILIKE